MKDDDSIFDFLFPNSQKNKFEVEKLINPQLSAIQKINYEESSFDLPFPAAHDSSYDGKNLKDSNLPPAQKTRHEDYFLDSLLPASQNLKEPNLSDIPFKNDVESLKSHHLPDTQKSDMEGKFFSESTSKILTTQTPNCYSDDVSEYSLTAAQKPKWNAGEIGERHSLTAEKTDYESGFDSSLTSTQKSKYCHKRLGEPHLLDKNEDESLFSSMISSTPRSAWKTEMTKGETQNERTLKKESQSQTKFLRWYSDKYLGEINKIEKQNWLTEKALAEENVKEREKEQSLDMLRRRDKERKIKHEKWLNDKRELQQQEKIRKRESLVTAEKEELKRKNANNKAVQFWLQNHPKSNKTSDAMALHNLKKITYKDSTTRVEPSMVNHNPWRDH